MRDFPPPLTNGTRFHFSTTANNMGSLVSTLELGEPDLLIVFADLAPTPEELARVLAGLKQAIVIVLLPVSRAGLELKGPGRRDSGQNTTEYGVFIAGVVVVVLVVVGIFTGALKTLWEKVAALITGG
ncbi:MAG: hypothetical protein ABSB41_12475 [Anaerolineales bacterium]|jgi:Flp pilus assembly pilin Flp